MAGLVFAQDFTVSGEMKTGYFWERILADGDEVYEEAKMHNNDDAGDNQGRFRMNTHLFNGVGGPDLWTELDAQIGIRTEIMPKVIPGFNIGFMEKLLKITWRWFTG